MGDSGLPGLAQRDVELLRKMFSSPLDIPAEWLGWLVSFIEVAGPTLPLSSIQGGDSIPRRPSGIASGEAMVWDGTTFARSTVTPLGISSLAGYPSDATKVLHGDGSWSAVTTTIPVGTTLPGSPSDGDKAILTDSLTAPTYAWLFQYVSGITSDSNKWVFIGGAPKTLSGAPGVAYNNAAMTQVAATGYYYHSGSSDFVVPNAGIYLVEGGAAASGATGTSRHQIAVFSGSTAPFGNSARFFDMIVTTIKEASGFTKAQLTSVAASTRVGVALTADAVSGTVVNRMQVSITPVRIA